MEAPQAKQPSASPSWVKVLVFGTGLLLLLAVGLVVYWKARPRSVPVPGGDDPRLTYATPYRNVHPHVKYVGDSVCADCHVTHADTYRQHPMGRSLTTVAAVAGRQRYDAEVHNPFERLGVHFRVEREGDRVFQRQRRGPEQGADALDGREEIQYVIGSGSRGYSYFSNREGYLFFTPISWFTQGNRWDLSPGFEESLLGGRAVQAGCLFCHTNYADAVPHTHNRYRAPIFHGHAIGCERCHGPGELHVQRREQGDVVQGVDDTIVNPSKLEPVLREAVCQQCHLEGESRVLRQGRGVFDFRPGLPLHLFWSVFVKHEALSKGHHAVSHVEQMHASRCFQASKGKMGCISCHDPHAVPDDKVTFYRDRCLQCHQSKGCSIPEPMRRQQNQEDSCSACHMHRESSTDIVHTAVTDHRVLRHPGHAPPPDRKSPPLLPGAIPLVYFHRDLVDPNDKAVARDLGVAMIEQARYSTSMQQYIVRMSFHLVEEAARAAPDDLQALNAYGFGLWVKGRTGEAQQAYETALALAPDDETTLRGATALATALRRGDEALALQQRLVAVSPHNPAYRYTLAKLLADQQQWSKVLGHCEAVLTLSPADLKTQLLLVEAHARLGNKERARRELQRLQAAQPADGDDLRRRLAELLR